MPKIAYKTKRFGEATMEKITKVNNIVEEYQVKGYSLTLRQTFYQMVARGYIENTFNNYKNLGKTISEARLAGLIDWNAITDRTRTLRKPATWKNPSSVIESAAYSYELDRWQGQPCYCEVWCEKDALREVVARGCYPTRTPYFSCRGYDSQSEMWSAANRFISRADRECVIIYVGDFDPSGVDMVRDVQKRMELFGASVKVHKIALTMEQIQQYNPPPCPAKTTDRRAKKFISQYGANSWELDALEPDVLESLINDTIGQYLDKVQFEAVCQKEQTEKEELYMLADRYHEAINLLQGA